MKVPTNVSSVSSMVTEVHFRLKFHMYTGKFNDVIVSIGEPTNQCKSLFKKATCHFSCG